MSNIPKTSEIATTSEITTSEIATTSDTSADGAKGDGLTFLELEAIGRDSFVAKNAPMIAPGGPTPIYGGQAAAQALRAAALTVDPTHEPHSLHGSFLRGGDREKPVELVVERLRDGRTFTTRRVTVRQDATVIFEANVSFHTPEPGVEVSPPMLAGVTPPEQLPLSVISDWHKILDVRVPGIPGREGETLPFSIDRLWARVAVPMTDDPMLHACMLVFISDLGGGLCDISDDKTPPYGPSLDHVVWFQTPMRADDWILLEGRPVKIGRGLGLYTATAHNRHGVLAAVLNQEMLLRPGHGTQTVR
jgi:acyl-CoA thioesterase II